MARLRVLDLIGIGVAAGRLIGLSSYSPQSFCYNEIAYPKAGQFFGHQSLTFGIVHIGYESLRL